jgi:carboxymethylenebutenolidase
VPFQFHVGDRDMHVPAEHVSAVENAVAGKADAEVFVYPGAQHGFYNRLRKEVFAEDAAARATSRVLPLLQKVTA